MFIDCRNNKCVNYWEDSCVKNLYNEAVIFDEDGRCETFRAGINEFYILENIPEGMDIKENSEKVLHAITHVTLGQCPCVPLHARTKDTLCPCKTAREDKICMCGLFKKKVSKNCNNCKNEDCFSRNENPDTFHESPPCTGYIE
jgi:hypothetical protein